MVGSRSLILSTSTMKEIHYTLTDIDAAAEEFLRATAGSRLFTLKGSMGAGKTTFVSAVCRQMGVTDPVSSPTFALVNEYQCNSNGATERIFHIDLYRLRDEEEAVHAGMEDCFLQAKRGEAYCFVEWPERAPNLLQMSRMEAEIEITGETERVMKLSKKGGN